MDKLDYMLFIFAVISIAIIVSAGLSLESKQEMQITESIKLQERQVIALEKISEKGE